MLAGRDSLTAEKSVFRAWEHLLRIEPRLRIATVSATAGRREQNRRRKQGGIGGVADDLAETMRANHLSSSRIAMPS